MNIVFAYVDRNVTRFISLHFLTEWMFNELLKCSLNLTHMFNESSLKDHQLLELWTKLIVLSFTTVIQCNLSIFIQEIFFIYWVVRVSINEIIKIVNDILDFLLFL